MLTENQNKIKILSVFGTRPEAIKMAPIVKELGKTPETFVNKICVTAQHRQMLDQVLRLFSIFPDYDLNVMQDNQTLAGVASAILMKLEPILKQEKPDWMLIQGDTTTVAAASLCAFYCGVKVGHVEAGLRTFDRRQPFPEEINRRVASVIADLHFSPTQKARKNLLNEGIPDSSILVTGNPVIDALKAVASLQYDPTVGCLKDVQWQKRIVLVTAHRRENFGDRLEQICLALEQIVTRFPDVFVVYPVHLNPKVRETVYQMLAKVPRILLTAPLEYLPLVYLMKRSTLVLTDSGGIQEEAPGLGKPVLVLRNVTERPEAVEAGTVKIVGTNCQRIVTETTRLLTSGDEYDTMARAINPYGDGHAAIRIVEALRRCQMR